MQEQDACGQSMAQKFIDGKCAADELNINSRDGSGNIWQMPLSFEIRGRGLRRIMRGVKNSKLAFDKHK